MILLERQPGLDAHDLRTSPVDEVWGLDARGLHDAYWASRRVQVVSRGALATVESGPTLYLLVEPDDLVLFDLRPALKKLQWTAARVARLRLVAPDTEQGYRERVRVDEGGRFAAVERLYNNTRARSVCRAFLTSSASIARAWSTAATRRESIAAMRRRTPREKLVSLRLEAQIADAGDPAERQTLVRDLMGRWSRVGSVVDGVYEYTPGIWLHETVRLGEGVRLIAPVWVGAGVSLPPGEVVVGPAALCDEAPLAEPTLGVDWGALAMPARRRVPSLTRQTLRRVSKRSFDIAFSLAVLAATLPLYPIIMLLIWLEDGRPFLFAHTRQTMHGRPFPCLKFRTMCKDAEAIKAQILDANEADGPQFFLRRDPRVLKVGALLRRSQLDELPQFLNVLAGHMSVVGPRPSPDRENQYCPAWREMRLGVRPGVTGLWQVRRTREPETDFQEWIRYDLEYVRNQSWRLDIWIIIQTVKRMIRG